MRDTYDYDDIINFKLSRADKRLIVDQAHRERKTLSVFCIEKVLIPLINE